MKNYSVFTVSELLTFLQNLKKDYAPFGIDVNRFRCFFMDNSDNPADVNLESSIVFYRNEKIKVIAPGMTFVPVPEDEKSTDKWMNIQEES